MCKLWLSAYHMTYGTTSIINMEMVALEVVSQVM